MSLYLLVCIFKLNLETGVVIMEKVKGLQLKVQGHKDLTEFAKGILALVNLKSQVKNTVVAIDTMSESNEVIVTVHKESDYKMAEAVESYLGKIIHREEVELLVISSEDLSPSSKKELEAVEHTYLYDEGNDYTVIYEKD